MYHSSTFKKIKTILQIAVVGVLLVVYGNNCGRDKSSPAGGAAPGGSGNNAQNLASCLSQSGKVCTYFGYFPGISSGVSGLQAPVRSASKFAFDRNGNLIFYSAPLNIIFRYIVSTGILNVVAGDGTVQTPYGGADARSSGLLPVGGIAVDSRNNIYWSSSANGIVYKIDASTNIIGRYLGVGHISGASCSTWAEGSAASAVDPCGVTGLAFDSLDNLYFIDTGGAHKVYKVENATGLVTTYAGGGATNPSTSATNCDGTTSSRIAYPDTLTIAPGNDDLYVTTYYNRVCKVVTGQPLKLVLVAGDGSSVNSGDGLAPTAAGLFGSPYVVPESGSNPRYIYILSGKVIRRIDNFPPPGGGPPVISTVAGTGTTGQPVSGTPAMSAQFSNILGGALSPVTGELYLASGTMIYKIRSSDQTVQAVAGLMPNIQATNSPRDYFNNWVTSLSSRLAFSIDETKVYLPVLSLSKIISVDITTGAFEDLAGTGVSGNNGDGPALTTQLKTPKTIRFYNSALYFSDSGSYTIRKLEGGSISTVAGTLGTNGGAGGRGSGDGSAANTAIFSNVLSDFDIDPMTGVFYVVDNIDIRKFTIGGTISTEYTAIDSITGQGIHLRSIAVVNNTVYFLGDDCKLRRMPTAGGAVTVVAGTGTCGYSGDGGPMIAANISPWTLQAWNGKLFLVDTSYGKVIRQFNFTTGNMELVAGTPAIGGYTAEASALTYLSGLGSMALKSDGSFIFWDSGRALLRGWQKGFARF